LDQLSSAREQPARGRVIFTNVCKTGVAGERLSNDFWCSYSLERNWWVLAYLGDLAVLTAKLRAEGLDVRNLGQVGITLWNTSQGFFFPVSELEENADLVERREFATILARRNGSSGLRGRKDLRLASL
jgi:hypothetical protein